MRASIPQTSSRAKSQLMTLYRDTQGVPARADKERAKELENLVFLSLGTKMLQFGRETEPGRD